MTGTLERLRRDSVGGSTFGDSCTSGAVSAEGSAAALLPGRNWPSGWLPVSWNRLRATSDPLSPDLPERKAPPPHLFSRSLLVDRVEVPRSVARWASRQTQAAQPFWWVRASPHRLQETAMEEMAEVLRKKFEQESSEAPEAREVIEAIKNDLLRFQEWRGRTGVQEVAEASSLWLPQGRRRWSEEEPVALFSSLSLGLNLESDALRAMFPAGEGREVAEHLKDLLRALSVGVGSGERGEEGEMWLRERLEKAETFLQGLPTRAGGKIKWGGTWRCSNVNSRSTSWLPPPRPSALTACVTGLLGVGSEGAVLAATVEGESVALKVSYLSRSLAHERDCILRVTGADLSTEERQRDATALASLRASVAVSPVSAACPPSSAVSVPVSQPVRPLMHGMTTRGVQDHCVEWLCGGERVAVGVWRGEGGLIDRQSRSLRFGACRVPVHVLPLEKASGLSLESVLESNVLRSAFLGNVPRCAGLALAVVKYCLVLYCRGFAHGDLKASQLLVPPLDEETAESSSNPVSDPDSASGLAGGASAVAEGEGRSEQGESDRGGDGTEAGEEGNAAGGVGEGGEAASEDWESDAESDGPEEFLPVDDCPPFEQFPEDKVQWLGSGGGKEKKKVISEVMEDFGIESQVKICDLGRAERFNLSPNFSALLSEKPWTVRTMVPCAPPENLRSLEGWLYMTVSPHDDMFSMGLEIWNLLFGRSLLAFRWDLQTIPCRKSAAPLAALLWCRVFGLVFSDLLSWQQEALRKVVAETEGVVGLLRLNENATEGEVEAAVFLESSDGSIDFNADACIALALDQPIPSPPTVRFRCTCDCTQPGETVFVAGSSEFLGSWDPDRSLPLSTSVSEFPMWSSPPLSHKPSTGSRVEFKLIVKGERSSEVRWEPVESNRVFRLVYGKDIEVEASWGEITQKVTEASRPIPLTAAAAAAAAPSCLSSSSSSSSTAAGPLSVSEALSSTAVSVIGGGSSKKGDRAASGGSGGLTRGGESDCHAALAAWEKVERGVKASSKRSFESELRRFALTMAAFAKKMQDGSESGGGAAAAALRNDRVLREGHLLGSAARALIKQEVRGFAENVLLPFIHPTGRWAHAQRGETGGHELVRALLFLEALRARLPADVSKFKRQVNLIRDDAPGNIFRVSRIMADHAEASPVRHAVKFRIFMSSTAGLNSCID
uniref:CBM20 domain-containing protein n=1 Tax=Chromera velia CCMP2878 TaxID=1169474 RepID=A0A0G4GQ47_9ALVE|eukprot:Cvel_705.t1-p1 / transcript=Cvel_705.t1 / gene=Cvel_705 / organism=Chromera_velia_CCMP2878 / gene_product=hypothetical protein / transcript_product=hypothetical protein / location=Cvel_scaffold22:17606-29135(+) / protein_length=1178 / sequence_SO=supercontig / SO=protein_coding / is_pseudo=false